MAIKIKHPGALHKELGYKPGAKIPMSVLVAEKAKARRAHDERMLKQLQFAINAHKFSH